jgi:flavin-dependent dehydrogenase
MRSILQKTYKKPDALAMSESDFSIVTMNDFRLRKKKMSQADFDVIIVGGRCAGATLAIRLARQQLKVLVVDRATFPSIPAVASSPMIYDGTIRMLDELGLKEEDYALPGSRAHQFILEFINNYTVVLPFSRMGLERNYTVGLDRAHFDNVVWKHMESHTPYVTARQGFAMTDVLKDSSGRITGIVGKSPDGSEERFSADLVVGADGRYSTMARKFGAKMVEERNEYTTGGFEAQWENVQPFAPGISTEACFYSTGRGKFAIFIPVSQGRYYVAAFMRSQDAQRGAKTPDEFYQSSLQEIPQAWKRLEGARQITPLEGMRPVENGYREAFGAGWALVGDAFHYKDPIDGQGIYDALTETKILAEAIAQWKSGKLGSWEEAGALYKEKAWAATYPMFNMTTARVKREVHTFPPRLIVNTIIKWMLTDPGYQQTFLRVLARVEDPSSVPTSPSLSMIWRGIARSFQSRGKTGPSVQPTPAVSPQ